MRMDADCVTRLARTGQTYAEAVSSAERDYLEAEESKKKREADAAAGKQAENQMTEGRRWMAFGSAITGASFVVGVLAAILSN
ncbi:hypothetical protein CSOJ01_09099 [Colletotrichum sojae]|uniref:Uncharacterized protein n=1 Tax=Colletotrichum sojae TaxID=2175907 RepID=A0A8H6J4L6_9PEZI|nr:hypothetical protein CSOJ01_09099 [Colletotrichum sojae]